MLHAQYYQHIYYTVSSLKDLQELEPYLQELEHFSILSCMYQCEQQLSSTNRYRGNLKPKRFLNFSVHVFLRNESSVVLIEYTTN